MLEVTAVNDIMTTKPRDKTNTLPNFLNVQNEVPLRANVNKDNTKPEDQQPTESSEDTPDGQEDKDLENFLFMFVSDYDDVLIYQLLENIFF